MKEKILVLKCNLQHEETWRYDGDVLERSSQKIYLQAFFNHDDVDVHGIMLKRGDKFLETFYADRWYNVFEMYDRDDQLLKGWYCNICEPAIFGTDSLCYVDLALDLLVFPDGRQLILDEDEFNALPISADTRKKALQGLRDLQAYFKHRFRET